MAASIQYVKEIYDGLKLWATWLPGTPLTIGTVGIFENRVFYPRSHLKSFGIKYNTKADPTTENLSYQSTKGVQMQFKVSGATSKAFQNLSKLDAGVGIDFKDQDGVIFSARDLIHHSIADIDKLSQKLLILFQKNSWPDNYAVITHLISAGSTTVLISGSKDSRVVIRAKANIGNSVVDLANVAGNLRLAYTSGMNIQIVAAHGLTPLFDVIRIKRDFWTGQPTVDRFGRSPLQPKFEKLTYENVGE
jgi:hypothetical protein